MPFVVTRCEDTQRWNQFVDSSPQGTVFCGTPFLDALGEEYELLLVESDHRPQLGAVVLKRNGQPIQAPYPFTMYQGILFDQTSRTMAHHSRVRWSLEVTHCLLAEMARRYDRISFCLHYGVDDLRSFQWFHYHEPAQGQFTIALRYTGLVSLASGPDLEAYLATIRKVRRYEYRRAVAEGLSVEVSTDLDTLDRLHQLTFERQGIARDPEERRLMLAIADAALSHGFGEMLLCRDTHGVAASATVFLYDRLSAYYLVAANNPDYRKADSGTYLMIENIRRCQARGLATLDCVGINSPNRGDYKISFNAKPVPYCVVGWERPPAHARAEGSSPKGN